MLSKLNSREEEFFEIWHPESNLEMLFADHISNIEELLVKLPRLICFLIGICSQSNSFEKKLESNLFFWIFCEVGPELLCWFGSLLFLVFVLFWESYLVMLVFWIEDKIGYWWQWVLPRDLEELRSQSWAFSLFVGMKHGGSFFFFWSCHQFEEIKNNKKLFFGSMFVFLK